jgi:hypothetical protein
MKITDEDRARCVACIANMRATSNAFYAGAVRTGNHAFIEFCGLMNEYIDICETALAAGQDFTMASIHSGSALPIQSFQASYLLEKLQCIYGASLPELFKKAGA